ncbi:MAG: COX15/CtaA family protein [Nocardioidaceae bacterium]
MGVIERTSPVAERMRVPSRRLLRRLAVASLVSNIVIVVTGGAVRLTASGLGCPTWPRCTDTSFVVHDAMGAHGFIEFGNRMLTFVLAAVAIATWVAAMRYRPRRRSLRRLATVLVLGVPAQAVLGGFTVLTDLNPYVVSLHLLLSLGMIAAAVVLVRRVDEDDRPSQPTMPVPAVRLAQATYAAVWVVLYVGTVVTGSGPHAGDTDAPRNGLLPAAISQVHADLVFLLVGLTVGTLVAFLVTRAPDRAVRAVTWLLGIELAQGLIGFVQYFTDLPIVLVGAHVLGAALVTAAATWMLLGTRERGLAARQDPTLSAS